MTRILGLAARPQLAVLLACVLLLSLVGVASNAAPISERAVREAATNEVPRSAELADRSSPIGQRLGEDPIVVPPAIGVLVAVFAIALFVGGVLLVMRPHLNRMRFLSWARRGQVKLVHQPEPAEQVAEQLASAAAWLRSGLLEGDARLAVQRCYAHLESGFGTDELARRPSETPLRYLHRVFTAAFGDGSVDPGVEAALRRLTSLFERARFSDNAVTEAMRNDAAEALEVIESFFRDRESVRLVEA